eukprot:29223-Pelagococcus_subviridis.AAC.2
MDLHPVFDANMDACISSFGRPSEVFAPWLYTLTAAGPRVDGARRAASQRRLRLVHAQRFERERRHLRDGHQRGHVRVLPSYRPVDVRRNGRGRLGAFLRVRRPRRRDGVGRERDPRERVVVREPLRDGRQLVVRDAQELELAEIFL